MHFVPKKKTILFLALTFWFMIVADVRARPRHHRRRACPTAALEPNSAVLVEMERKKLMNRLSRLLGNDTAARHDSFVPSPPSMLTKLASRKRKTGKRSVSASGDDFDYWATETVYVPARHLTRGTTRTHTCLTPGGGVATCVIFPVNHIGNVSQLQRVSLWMHYQLPSITTANSVTASNASNNITTRTLEVYEIIRTGAQVHSPLLATVSTVTDEQKGWVEADLSSVFVGRNDSLNHDRVLRVQWKDPIHHTILPPVSLNDSKDVPFLEIVFRKSEESDLDRPAAEDIAPDGRSRRAAVASHRQCTLRHFAVNFTDYGWHSTILAPGGYVAGYCAGECLRRSESEGLGGLIRDHSAPGSAPCCAPKPDMSPLQIVYIDRSRGNENIMYKTMLLPNMILTGCSCR